VTAPRISLVHRVLASVLAVSLTGFPVRVLAATELLDQGTSAQSVPVQPVPPPPAAPQQPAYVQPAPQAPAPVQQPAPQQPAYVQPAPQAPAPVQQPAPQQPAYAQPPAQYQQPAAAQPAPQQAPPAAQAPVYALPPAQYQQPAAAQPAPQQAPPAAQAPVYAPPPQVPAAPGAPAPSGGTRGIVPPGAVPVPQSAVPQTRSQSDVEKELGTAPAPAPPPLKAQRSPADDRLIRLEWRPEHLEGNYGYGPLMQVPVMGNDRRPLVGRSLYTALGRPDLAKEYERRQSAKRLMGVGAGLLLISGAVVALSAFGIHGCNPGDVHCQEDRDRQLKDRFYWSGGLALGGAVLGIASSSYSAHPVSRNELMSLIRDHNRQVRADAGLSIAPTALPGGAGVRVSGSF